MISFYPNCSLPLQAPTSVAAPNVRSTLDIVWSCTSILILCSWSIQHLNVPPQFHPETTMQAFRLKMCFFFQKLKWMLATLIAPEALLAKALTDYRSAHLHSKLLQEFADEDGVPWSKTHTFFADMGGFAIRFSNGPVSWSNNPASPAQGNPSADLPSALSTSRRNENSAVNSRGLDWEQVMRRCWGDGETNAQNATGLSTDTSREGGQSHQGSEQELSSLHFEVNGQTQDTVYLVRHALPQTPSLLESQTHSAITPVPSGNFATQFDERPNNGIETETAEDNRVDWNSPHHLHPQKQSHLGIGFTGPETWRWLRRDFRYNIERRSLSYGRLAWQPHERHTEIGMEILSGLVIDRSHEKLITINGVSTILALEGDVWVLTAAQLYEARASNLISKLPYMTEDEISDKNKGDLLTKLFVLGQVVWLVVQMAARAITHKTSSPLEVMTLSFAACAFMIYLLLLNHPQDVKTPVYIRASRPCSLSDMRNMAFLCPTHFWAMANMRSDNAIPNNAYHHIWPLEQGRNPSNAWLLIGAGCGAAVFGGLHLIAWNIQFPTQTEHFLWKIASFITMLVPIADSLIFYLQYVLFGSLPYRWLHLLAGSVYNVILMVTMLAFVLARVFLVFEAFRSLYFLPPDAYTTTWAANMPHIG
ncbi:hypothetical protein PT974_06993 [Cladobotryum mycophilum]|uniref:Uncharacterized protein n=1 Tax=Cladobotryum mycophilum TaxID=491253 RepID=A0ABR0SNC5_9HYPO